MARKPKFDRPRDRHISIPTSLDNRVVEKIKDPVTGKPKTGAYSKLVERLIRQWLDEEDGG